MSIKTTTSGISAAAGAGMLPYTGISGLMLAAISAVGATMIAGGVLLHHVAAKRAK